MVDFKQTEFFRALTGADRKVNVALPSRDNSSERCHLQGCKTDGENKPSLNWV